MNYIGKFITNFRDFYNEINSATLTGAIDVVVIRQPDGSFQSSPFHVRFGKIGVLRSREKIVDIEVNGEPIDIHMKLGESGEAFFVEEVAGDYSDLIPDNLATSPIPPTTDIGAELEKMKLEVEFRERQASLSKSKEQGSVLVANVGEKVTTIATARSVECVVLQMESNQIDAQNNTYKNGTSPLVTDFVPIKIEPPTSSVVVQNGGDTNANQGGGGEGVAVSLKPDDHDQQEDSKLNNSNNSSLAARGDDESRDEDANDQRDDEASTDKVKRKRKKKSMIKRKTRSSRDIACLTNVERERSDSRGSASTDQDTPHSHKLKKPHRRDLDEIFHMEDDDEDFKKDHLSRSSPIYISRSFSLPLSSSLPIHDLPYSWKSKKLSATFAGEFHPFSDGDVTPITSPAGSRPPSPKSDSEFERQKHDAMSQTEMGQISWGWGELPSVPSEKSREWRKGSVVEQTSGQLEIKQEGGEIDKRSMLGGMLNFMRTTKKMRHAPESEGIFLDELNPEELDPEVAALYFPKFRSHYDRPLNDKEMSIKDEDTESGNGPSLPHSPNSVEGAIGGPMCVDSDSEERPTIFDYTSKYYNDLELSLCGGLLEHNGDVPHERFLQFVVTYDDFCEKPSLLQNPNLVLRMGGKYYNWQAAGPMLLSLALFQRPLTEKAVMTLLSEHMPKKKKKTSYSSWWSWRRSTAESDNIKQDQSEVSGLSDLEHSGKLDSLTPPNGSKARSYKTQVSIPPRQESTGTSTEPVNLNHASINVDSDAESIEATGKRSEKYKKTLFLSTDELVSLNLKDGANEVEFSVTTAYQGTTRCKCYIYLWNYDDKIVISDIDGTITKSDVLGHILPIIGNDWAQSGVAQLFTKIRKNGYHFLYLSARAIGQARVTKEYLRNVRQGDLCLPDGPLLLSPTSLINAFHREVIEKKPEIFKISCLTNIKNLFPSDTPNSFYAGFGNKINDTWAYRAVDIPITRIFTINHRGELKSELIQTFESSYTRLSDVVDHVFPPLERRKSVNGQLSTNFVAPEQYSSFTYWRLPVASVTPSGSFTNINTVGTKSSPAKAIADKK